MSAIPEEISVILNDMALIKAITLGGRCYYQGVLHGIDTVIVFSNMWKVAAAITATTLITTFKVDAICFTGVASRHGVLRACRSRRRPPQGQRLGAI